MNLTKEQKILLNLTARSIAFDNTAVPVLSMEDFEGVDWRAIVKESVVQAVPLATLDVAGIYKEYIPEDIYARWKNIAASVLAKNFQVVQSQVEMIELLENKYPYIILKGMAAAAYYPNPDFRALGDVDFLIDPLQKSELEKLFEDAGYEKCLENHPNHIVFRKPSAHLEMHFEVAGVPYDWQGEEVRAFLKTAVFTPETRIWETGNFFVPNDLYHGLILLLHMQHHMLAEGLGLRHLSDWAVYVARTAEKQYWEETLLPFLKKIGLFTYAAIMTKTCAKYLHILCPVWAEAAEEQVCDEVIRDILLGGNFGQKDKDRSKSGMLISEHGKRGTKHGAIYNLTHTLHGVVIRTPCVKKVPLLYPFVYVGKVLRFLFLSLIGKRPSLTKMGAEAKKRKSVYDKLQIFEVEEVK